MFMIALLCLSLALLALLLLHPTPPLPPLPVPPPPVPPAPVHPPLPSRHVSFSLAGHDASPGIQRRWSSPFHRRKSSPPAPHATQPIDEFGWLPPSSPPPSFDLRPPPLSARRLSTPLRLSLASKRSASYTDQIDALPSPPLSSTSASQSSPPLQRTRFVNPFRKLSRSRTLSPPSTFTSLDSPSSNLSGMPPPPPPPPPSGRRALVNKFKSVFKSISPEPSPIIRSKPFRETINTKLRRKPVSRTQPYGPPWNAPMPVLDSSLSPHSFQKPAETISPSPRSSRKHSVHECSLPEKSSPGQLSPRTFINELDEKLSLLQQQLIPSPHK